MPADESDPAAEVPRVVAETLEGLDDRELRAVVHYAQELLGSQSSTTPEIEARPGEELVHVSDEDGYTFVVVEREGATAGVETRVAYRVTWEPDVGEGDGRYRWHYLGSVEDDPGGG